MWRKHHKIHIIMWLACFLNPLKYNKSVIINHENLHNNVIFRGDYGKIAWREWKRTAVRFATDNSARRGGQRCALRRPVPATDEKQPQVRRITLFLRWLQGKPYRQDDVLWHLHLLGLSCRRKASLAIPADHTGYYYRRVSHFFSFFQQLEEYSSVIKGRYAGQKIINQQNLVWRIFLQFLVTFCWIFTYFYTSNSLLKIIGRKELLG